MNNTWESDKDDDQAIKYPTMKTHLTDGNWYKDHLIQVFTLPDDLTRRLKKPQESFEHAIESIRALLNSWKMGAALDNPLRCENPRLFIASSKSVLHTSKEDSEGIGQ